MLKLGARFGAGLMCVAAIGLLSAATAWAQDKELSDKSVRALMRYTWPMIPEKYTPPSGKTIVVDKKKPKEVVVPLDVAREVVKVGYYSAHAQMCKLWAEEKANFDTLMLRQQAKKKWSDQQLLYIQKLHQATVMFMTGKVTFVEREGKEIVARRPAKTNPTGECPAARRKIVKTQIANYIKGGKN